MAVAAKSFCVLKKTPITFIKAAIGCFPNKEPTKMLIWNT